MLSDGMLMPVLIALAAVVLLLLILVIVLFSQVRGLKVRLNTFLQGKDAASLEDEIVRLFDDNRYLKEHTDLNTDEIADIRKKMRRHFKKSGIVKYDAFHQMGGELSYVLALLDDYDNGFLLNSVHSSEGSYSYIKEIRKGESDIELGAEEATALTLAKNSGKHHKTPKEKEA